jgi:hypothetical protein
MLKEEQDEETHHLSSADNHLSDLAARGVRPTTAATDADPHPTRIDSGTSDSDPGAAYTDTHPSNTQVDPRTSNADGGTPYPNTHPSDTHVDCHTSHT